MTDIEFTCSCPEGDDGTTYCWLCGYVGPHAEFTPVTHRQRFLKWWQRPWFPVKVTYYRCSKHDTD